MLDFLFCFPSAVLNQNFLSHKKYFLRLGTLSPHSETRGNLGDFLFGSKLKLRPSKEAVSTEELMLSNCGSAGRLENPLDSKEIQAVSPKGNQPSICIRRTEAEAEAPIRWLSDAKSLFNGKDSDAGKD